MKIAICDDCLEDAQKLKNIVVLNKNVEKSNIDIFIKSSSLLNRLQNKSKYDVFYLDVDMPEIDGINLGKQIRYFCPDSFIVFVTNYPEFAIDAYDCEAYHYLVKPLNVEKAQMVLRKIITIYNKNHSEYSIKTKSGCINIPINELYYVECCKRHIIFHLLKTKYEIPGKISDAFNYLKSFDFCQVHQGYIVNLRKIVSIDRLSIALTNGEHVPISQRKKAEVISQYINFIGEIV